MLFIEDMKQYRKDCRADEEKYAELYAYIWNRCSLEAQQLLEQQKVFRRVARKCDTVGLWKLIQDTFLRMDNYNNKKLAAFSSNRYFNERLYQGSNETVATFKERIEYAIKAFEHNDMNPPDEGLLALMFVDKLDENRFANFKKEYMRDLKKGFKEPPGNIQEALNEINKYKFNNPSSGNSNNGYRNTKNQHSRNSAVYATKGNKNDVKSSEATVNKSSGGVKQSSDENKSNDKEVVCYGCKEKGHILPNCPKVNNKRASNHVMKSSFFCLSASVVQSESDNINEVIDDDVNKLQFVCADKRDQRA